MSGVNGKRLSLGQEDICLTKVLSHSSRKRSGPACSSPVLRRVKHSQTSEKKQCLRSATKATSENNAMIKKKYIQETKNSSFMHDRKRSLRSGRLRSLNVGQEGVSEQSKQHFNITSTENDDETPLNDDSSLPKLLRGDTFQMSAIDKCKEWCTVEAPSPVPSLSQNASLGPPEGESEFSFSDSSRDTYDAQLKEVAGQVNSITNMMKMVFERLTPTVSAEEKKFMENMKAIFKIVPEGERGHFTTDVWNLALLYTRYLHPKLGINVVKHEGDLFCKEATDKSNM